MQKMRPEAAIRFADHVEKHLKPETIFSGNRIANESDGLAHKAQEVESVSWETAREENTSHRKRT
jgi:hypothetical protein